MQLQRWLRLSRESLKENYRGARILIALTFFLSLFAFIHFTEVHVAVLELDSTAKEYIVAKIDFTFPDEEATVILRHEALIDISSIYQISLQDIKEGRKGVENFFINNKKWRSEIPSTFDEVYHLIEFVSESLRQVRIADSRTIKKVDETNYQGKMMIDLSIPPSEEGPIGLPKEFWNQFTEKLLTEENGIIDQKALQLVVEKFEQQEPWEIEVDYEELRKFRNYIESMSGGKITHVKAGSLIISQGDIVTERHNRQLKEMKKELAESQNLWGMDTISGSLILSFMLTMVIACYLRLYHKQIYYSCAKLSLYTAIIVISLIFTKIVEFLLLENRYFYFETVRFPILIPLAAILLSVLLNKQLALFTSFFLSIVIAISLSLQEGCFLLMNFTLSVAAIFLSQSMNKRKEVFKVCSLLWFISVPIIIGSDLISTSLFSMGTVYDLLSSFALLLIEATLIALVLPLLESIFNVMTDLRLMELMDPNNELIRRLCLEAPGTYQHSMMVGILAESAAIAIGANGLLCRVSALFHDIGKLFNPNYFTENQFGEFNIHQLLTPLESAMVIIAHVLEGVELAKKYHLPKVIIDMIQQHHGTTMVAYFYNKEVELREGNPDNVDQSIFTYPGPKPQTKEAALLMIADTVEAASRSLDEITEKSVFLLVEKLVSQKIHEGQFAESDISFKELEIAKKVIIQTLYVSRHGRVKYQSKE